MSDDLVEYLRMLDMGLTDKAADEISSLRARLEQAERERDGWKEVATKCNHLSEDLARRAGFRAGIEAADNLSKWHSDTLTERILALSPTDNTMTVAEAARVLLEAYDRQNPMRTADQHPANCDCLRCCVDGLRAYLAAQKGE